MTDRQQIMLLFTHEITKILKHKNYRNERIHKRREMRMKEIKFLIYRIFDM
jgi:hypothetical protein